MRTSACFWRVVGAMEESVAQYRLALALQSDQPEWLADLAWILATQEDKAMRDPAEALRLAKEACRLTQSRDAVCLESLAAALAASGRAHEAIQTARAAVLTAARRPDRLARIQEELEHLEKGKSFAPSAPARFAPYVLQLPVSH